MAKKSMQKMKLLYLMKIFIENTDENCKLTLNQIIQMLKEYSIEAERKSLYDDIECLRMFGMDINCEKGKNFVYYLASRDFELPELKLLVDTVQASKFITAKKSMELIKKLSKLTSKGQGGILNRQVFVLDRVKASNEKIYYNVDHIHEAIQNNRQIKFKYFDYDMRKEKIFRKQGEFYNETPIALTFNDDNYYLITYKDKYKDYANFRVDKMESVIVTQDKRILPKDKFDLAKYTKEVFSMYSGEENKVKVKFHSSLAGVVIDRFGRDVPAEIIDENNFYAYLKVKDSPIFLSWIIGFQDKAEVVEPKHIREELAEMLLKISKIYEQKGNAY